MNLLGSSFNSGLWLYTDVSIPERLKDSNLPYIVIYAILRI